jgi:ribosome-interacting GTPase 1
LQPPDVKFIKKESGGIGYQEMVKQTKGMNVEVARLVCKEYKISCAEIILREDITVDQLIDVIEGDRAYIPGMLLFNSPALLGFIHQILTVIPFQTVLYVFNKIDSLWIEELDILDRLDNVVPSKFYYQSRICQILHCSLKTPSIPAVSSQHQWNLEELMEEIWDRCNMLRIYTKVRLL